jgi:hypothetical protein
VRFVAALTLSAVLELAGAGSSSIRYAGVHCDAGRSSRGTPSVVCFPVDHRGYGVVMNGRAFLVMHLPDRRVVLLRPQR